MPRFEDGLLKLFGLGQQAGRRPQDVDGFSNSFFRPKTPALYPIGLVTDHEGRGQKLGSP